MKKIYLVNKKRKNPLNRDWLGVWIVATATVVKHLSNIIVVGL